MTAEIQNGDHEHSPSLPIARLDLAEEIRRMREGSKHLHLAKTVVRSPDQRLVLMTLQRAAGIPRHQANGALTLQVLEGRLIVTLLESSFDLGPGQLLAIASGVSHAVVAIEDSALLLTIAWRGHGDHQA